MEKKLRLSLFEDCNRNCAGCCNKSFDIANLEQETDFRGYDSISLTGGEPMLKPMVVLQAIADIRSQNPTCSIYMYTADVRDTEDALYVLARLNGLTLTLHDDDGFAALLALNDIVCDSSYYDSKSMRLNVRDGIDMSIIEGLLYKWEIKDIEWKSDCPLPENEVFKKYFK